ncbi:MAG: hypothetical protein NTW29_13030 [Bacteroidetes bacterium]|nr:hypothetical protein [Bacteroidota bacterium]
MKLNRTKLTVLIYFTGILFSFTLKGEFTQKGKPSDYILLECREYPAYKNVDLLIFSMENIDPIDIRFGQAFKISKREFLSIFDAIRVNKFTHEIDTAEIGLYNFWLVRNNQIEKFATKTKNDTKEVFNTIVMQVKNRRMKESIRRLLSYNVDQMKSFD